MAPKTKLDIPDTVWRQAKLWIEVFSNDWHGETPTKLHTRQLSESGTPEFSPEFARFLYADDDRDRTNPNHRRNPEDRLRTTRAFRRLRRRAPREFDVLYMLVAHKRTIEDVAMELTQRAIRLDKPERYDVDDVRVLMLSGLDKVIKWW